MRPLIFQVENWGQGKGRLRRNPNYPIPELSEDRRLSIQVSFWPFFFALKKGRFLFPTIVCQSGWILLNKISGFRNFAVMILNRFAISIFPCKACKKKRLVFPSHFFHSEGQRALFSPIMQKSKGRVKEGIKKRPF